MIGADLSQTLEKGTLLIIETGDYSDLDWHGPVRMLKAATKLDLVKAFRAEATTFLAWERAYEFLPWLIRVGWAEAVENSHLWQIDDRDLA